MKKLTQAETNKAFGSTINSASSKGMGENIHQHQTQDVEGASNSNTINLSINFRAKA
jgi:hypothetical protein